MTNYTTGAAIYAYADGAAWTSNSVPSYLSFHTATSGSATTTEKMVIKNNGNVGIGTTSPNEKLHVAGNIHAFDTSADRALFASTAAGSTTIAVRSNGVTHFNGGNVGIGTTSPGNKLHVNGGEIQVVNGTYGKLLLQNSNNYVYGDQNGVGIFNANNNLRLYTVGSERIRITSAGKVGIGTNSPTYDLSVAGAISGAGFVTYTKNYGSLNSTGNGSGNNSRCKWKW